MIDFSFSRTPIEDVYTKIVFKYDWDYARGEFNKSTEDELPTGDYFYDYGYYGFTIPDNTVLYEHPDSTLVIDDDRGKYIRKSDSHDTAQAFANWFLLWYFYPYFYLLVFLFLISTI